jgi:hypothetical protein
MGYLPGLPSLFTATTAAAARSVIGIDELVAESGADLQSKMTQAASEGKILRLLPITYQIDTQLSIPNNLVLIGAGKYLTTIEVTDKNVSAFDGSGKTGYTLSDFGVTHNAVEGEYNELNGYAFELGTGNGSSRNSVDVTLQNLYIRNVPVSAIYNFQGGRNWTVQNCHIENCGRGGIILQGVEFAKVVGNYIDTIGDDGIAFHRGSVGCVATGNTIKRAGHLIDNPAAGIVMSGGCYNSIAGNAMFECFEGIATRRAAGSDEINGWGRPRGNSIAGNAIYGVSDNPNTGVSPIGIALSDTLDCQVTGNNVFAIRPDGAPVSPVEIKDCDNVTFSDCYLYGSYNNLTGTNREVEFSNCKFFPLDYQSSYQHECVFSVVGGRHTERLRLVNCSMPENTPNIVRLYAGAEIEKLEIHRMHLSKPPRIGFVSGVLSGATTAINLQQYDIGNQDRTIATNKGLLVRIKDGYPFTVGTRTDRTTVTANGQANVGDASIAIDSETLSYADSAAWLEKATSHSQRRYYYLATDAVVGTFTTDGITGYSEPA